MKSRVIYILFVCLGIVLFFSGCTWKGIDELYQLPQQSEDYLKLQEKIDRILNAGAEYSAPISGENRSSVQLYDLNGDGVKEAIAFFKDAASKKPLKIYVFSQVDDEYKTAAVIEAEGTDIGSISYTDFNGDDIAQIVVCWKISSEMQLLDVYSAADFQMTRILTSDFSEYSAYDISGDGLDELIVIRNSDGDYLADVYSTDGAEFESPQTVPLSSGLSSVDKVLRGYIGGHIPAVFVEGALEDDSIITDILVFDDGALSNISADETGKSAGTIRSYTIYSSDVNKDGVIEIPEPQLIVESEDSSFYILNWYRYTIDGERTKVMTTYHNYSDGWYLTIPDSWTENLSLRRVDEVSGERALIFSAVTDGEARDFLAVYTLSGDNKEDRAELEGRFILHSEGDVIYAAEILGNDQTEVSEEMVLRSFGLIVSEWDS